MIPTRALWVSNETQYKSYCTIIMVSSY